MIGWKSNDEQENLEMVQKNGLAICRIRNPSEAVQMAAVRQNEWAIDDIQNPSEAAQLAAVQQNGLVIQHIRNPSETVQLAAARQFGRIIQAIKNPSEALQLAAVQQNGSVIEYIDNPSEAVQLTAFACGGGLPATRRWTGSFRPSARDFAKAIQASNRAFVLTPDPHQLYEPGIEVIQACLAHQPTADILDLAAVAPDLFEPPSLREILRDALQQQAHPAKAAQSPRSL